jgi:replicative DNA helicase
MNDNGNHVSPSAPLAEKAVLSAILQQPEVWLGRAHGDGLMAEHFHAPGRRLMWDTICQRVAAGKSLELVAFVQDAALEGTLDSMGGASGIGEIYSEIALGQTRAWAEWVAALRETMAQRRAQRLAVELAESDTGEAAVQVVNRALDSLSSALRGPSKSANGKELMAEFMEWFEASANGGDMPGLATGYQELDQNTGGMRPGDFIVICALPSQGKSVMMYEMADYCDQQGKRAAIFSFEVMKVPLAARLISCRGRVPLGHIMQPKLALRVDLMAMKRVIPEIAKSKLTVSDDVDMTIEGIAAEAQRIRDEHGELDLIVVDYIQLIKGSGEQGENREREVARISAGLKRLAMRMKCPVVSGSQLNDKGQARESRAIVQDADWVLYIVEEGVKVAKMRNGRRNYVLPLFLNGPMQRFQRDKPPEE